MKRRFQLYVLAVIFLTVLVELLVWVYIPSDGLTFEQWEIVGYGAVGGGDLVSYALLLASHVLFLYGLYLFHPSARRLFLFYVVLAAVLVILIKWYVIPRIALPFSIVLWLFDIAILILAFFSPARAEFKEHAS